MSEKNNNTSQFIKQLAEREGISEEKIRGIIIESFNKSYCRGENEGINLHFEFDTKLSVYRTYKIVEEVNNSKKEIAKNDELLKKGKIKDGIFFLSLDTRNLPFSLSYEIKKQLRKDLGEVGWERQYKLFKPLQGQIMRGSIKNSQEGYYLVDLERGVGHWEEREWNLSEKPRLGQSFFFLVREVREEAKEGMPQVLLTRYGNLFLHRLFELNVPQIKEGIIIIRHILRVPGILSKVVVESKKIGIDPLGTCIGRNAERIRKISQIVYPERVDISCWYEDKEKLLSSLLSPAKMVSLVKRENNWDIIVLREKAALILEHEGKILKEIGKFLGKSLHVQIFEEIKKRESTIIVWNRGLDDKEIEMLCKK